MLRRMDQEEWQLFRSYLKRMGAGGRRLLLDSDDWIHAICHEMFELDRATGNAEDALSEFTSRTGDVRDPGGGLPSYRYLMDYVKGRAPVEFRYTPLDWLLQYLLDHSGEMASFFSDPSVEESVDQEFLEEFFPLPPPPRPAVAAGGDRPRNRGCECLLPEQWRSETLPANATENLSNLLRAMVTAGVYAVHPEDVAEDELTSSGSEDTGDQ